MTGTDTRRADERDTDENPDDNTDETRAAVVLAGGYSTRFGDDDKVFAELGGRPLLAHVVARVRPVVDVVRVSCRDDQLPAVRRKVGDRPGVDVVTDPVPDRGPVAGVIAALADCEADAAAVCAADEPFVDPDLLAYLFERREANGADCVVPRGFDGWLQTTQAVYRVDALLDCETGPDASLRSVVSRFDATVVPAPVVEEHASKHVFLDVNTQADLERAEQYRATVENWRERS